MATDHRRSSRWALLTPLLLMLGGGALLAWLLTVLAVPAIVGVALMGLGLLLILTAGSWLLIEHRQARRAAQAPLPPTAPTVTVPPLMRDPHSPSAPTPTGATALPPLGDWLPLPPPTAPLPPRAALQRDAALRFVHGGA